MADIINLNKWRKARDKAAETEAARENRVRHGRSKAEKTRESIARDKEAAELSGKQREDDQPA